MNAGARAAQGTLKRFSAYEIAQAIAARVFSLPQDGTVPQARASDPMDAAVFTTFAIDSRRVVPGSLFFAIKGSNHDGHDFIPDALAAGASGVVVSDECALRLGTAPVQTDVRARAAGQAPAQSAGNRPGDGSGGGPAIGFLVPDTLRALQDLAARARIRLPTVVGITGSAGKTTAKEMTAAVLEKRRRTGRTAGNLNNLFGLPLTLLNLPDEAEVAVLEMGMSYPGEIARLVEICDPDIGVILNVREAHLGNFPSLAAIAEAKGELFRGMRKDATAVWNAADPHVGRLAGAFPGRKISFALDASADLVAHSVEDDIVQGVRFRLRVRGQDHEARLSMFGTHNVENALAALGVAFAFGNDLDGALHVLAQIRPAPMRGVVVRLRQGIVLVDDTYNSNPSAMASVLSSLAVTSWPGRKVLVAGDMLELGPGGPAFHRQVGAQAARAGIGLLAAVGPMAEETIAGARSFGSFAIAAYPDSEAVANDAGALLAAGDLVVVKGSRGMAMEKFVEAAKAALGEGRA